MPTEPKVIRSLSTRQAADLCRLYQNEWWTKGRKIDDVRRMLDYTDLVFGLEDPESGALQGFARILSDRIYKALILDVIIDPELRGRGYGRLLLEEILNCEELAEVRHFELYCESSLIPFYERWGFRTGLDALHLMRRG